MKSIKDRIGAFARKKRYSIPTAIGLVLVLWAVNAASGKEPAYETREAARAEVSQMVSVTGNVKSASAVDLAFERGGKVAQVLAKVGDEVEEGQTIARLSNGDLSAQLESSLANLQREQVKLSELRRGARGEARAVSSASVSSAETTLSNARLALIDKINDAFAKADDAVRNNADQLFENPGRSASFGISVSSGGTTYRIGADDTGSGLSINAQRREVEDILEDWQLVSHGSADSSLEPAAREAERNLVTIQKLLNDIALEVNRYSADSSSANAVYAGYKSDISTARSSLNAALTSLRAAVQTYNSAKSGIEIAMRENELKTAPATAEEMAIQEANIRQAQAQVDSARADLAKTIIIAPVSGVITKIDADVGEIVSMNTPMVSMIAEADLEIEVNVPEADLAKVRPGAEADVTFDAYGKDFIAKARVISIDPAETVIDGVPTYRTILQFVENDARIRSGLTANVDIRGERKEGVIAVPQRAVVTNDGRRTVRVLSGSEVVERDVSVGLRGSDGLVEIVSGLAEGDLVIISSPEE